MTGASVSEI